MSAPLDLEISTKSTSRVLHADWRVALKRVFIYLASSFFMLSLIVFLADADWPLPSPWFLTFFLFWFWFMQTASDPLVRFITSRKVKDKSLENLNADFLLAAVTVTRPITSKDLWGWLVIYPDRLEYTPDQEDPGARTIIALDSAFELKLGFLFYDTLKLVLPCDDVLNRKSYFLTVAYRKEFLRMLNETRTAYKKQVQFSIRDN